MAAKKKLVGMEAKLGGIELKLVEAKGLNLAHVDKITDLKAALEVYENKWYNKGFVDVENSMEPIVHQSLDSWVREGVAGGPSSNRSA